MTRRLKVAALVTGTRCYAALDIDFCVVAWRVDAASGRLAGRR